MEWANYSWVLMAGVGIFFALFAIAWVCVALEFPSYLGSEGVLMVCLVGGIMTVGGSILASSNMTESANNATLNEYLKAEYGVIQRTPNTFPGIDVFTPPDYHLTIGNGEDRETFTCRLAINADGVEPPVQALCSPDNGTAPAPAEFIDLNALLSTPTAESTLP